MVITIDAAGRIVIPKALRVAAGIKRGMPLEAHFREGRIEIEPAPLNVELPEKQGIQVAVPLEVVAALTSEDVEDTVATLRAYRGRLPA